MPPSGHASAIQVEPASRSPWQPQPHLEPPAATQHASSEIKDAKDKALKELKALDRERCDSTFAAPVVTSYPELRKEYLAAVAEPMDLGTLQKRMGHPRQPLYTWRDWQVRPSEPPWWRGCAARRVSGA